LLYAGFVSTSLPAHVRAIAAAETHPLRLAILRPGYPPVAVAFPGDDDAGTAHIGCFVRGALDAETIVAIASIFFEPPPEMIAEK